MIARSHYTLQYHSYHKTFAFRTFGFKTLTNDLFRVLSRVHCPATVCQFLLLLLHQNNKERFVISITITTIILRIATAALDFVVTVVVGVVVAHYLHYDV